MINYLAVLVASIIGYAIPMIWYSPKLFGKEWQKLSGVNMKDMKPSPAVMIAGFVATIVFNVVLAVVIGYSGVTTFALGAGIGAMLWLGFIATTLLNGVFYQKMPMKLYWINSIPYLISMAIVGGILAVWQ